MDSMPTRGGSDCTCGTWPLRPTFPRWPQDSTAPPTLPAAKPSGYDDPTLFADFPEDPDRTPSDKDPYGRPRAAPPSEATIDRWFQESTIPATLAADPTLPAARITAWWKSMLRRYWKQSDPRARSACPCVVLCGPFPPFFCRPMGSPPTGIFSSLYSQFLRQHFVEWSAHVHAAHGSLIIGGAISGSYRRPRCSRRPPPVARGVARVLCLGQTGHRDNPTESSEDARTTSSPDQNRLLPGCEPRLSLTPSTPTSRT